MKKNARDFTDRVKAIVTQEHLKKVFERYQAEKGLWLHREPVAILKRPSSAAAIRKPFCTKVKAEYVAEIMLLKLCC